MSDSGRQNMSRSKGSVAKREHVLDAAQQVFADQGMDKASMRAIAKQAGYTAGALYFYFESKEDIYGALLDRSLLRLRARLESGVSVAEDSGQRMREAALAFFQFYLANPRDLDLGFYLFRGGMRPHGLGPMWDQALNQKLLAALAPLRSALNDMDCDDEVADAELTALFAHMSGVLLLHHTGRLRLFETDADSMVRAYLYDLEHRITRAKAVAAWQNAHDSEL